MIDQKTVSAPEIRLNKFLAQAGLCSRRAADELIAAGRVMVNGLPAGAGTKVVPGQDTVSLDGRLVASLNAQKNSCYTYIMLNKPIQVVSTARDPQKRPTVLDLVPKELKDKRLYPVGRLDFFSEGLLLLTDDGDLTHRLTHPGWHLPKTYEVVVRGKIPLQALKIMHSGMCLAEGEKLAPVQATILCQKGGTTTLEMVLHQGVNRQIRRMCRDLDITILSLKRTAQGPLHLGTLPKGQCRALSRDEIQVLRQSVGLE